MDFVVTDLEEIKHMISLLLVYIFFEGIEDCGKKSKRQHFDEIFILFKVFFGSSGRVLILCGIGSRVSG